MDETTTIKLGEGVPEFSFVARAQGGTTVQIINAVQIGVFAVAPSWQRDENEHTIVHWPSGCSICRAEDFDLAIRIADDASRYSDAALAAVEGNDPFFDSALETDDLVAAEKLLGGVVKWINAIAQPLSEAGVLVGYMVRNEGYKSYRDWRWG